MKKAPKKTTKKNDTVNAGEYVICRGYYSGVHAGVMEKIEGDWIYLRNARRVCYWSGAASLSELAVHGPNPAKAGASKICAVVPRQRIKLSDVCEVIVCEPAGEKWLREVPVWRA